MTRNRLVGSANWNKTRCRRSTYHFVRSLKCRLKYESFSDSVAKFSAKVEPLVYPAKALIPSTEFYCVKRGIFVPRNFSAKALGDMSWALFMGRRCSNGIFYRKWKSRKTYINTRMGCSAVEKQFRPWRMQLWYLGLLCSAEYLVLMVRQEEIGIRALVPK